MPGDPADLFGGWFKKMNNGKNKGDHDNGGYRCQGLTNEAEKRSAK